MKSRIFASVEFLVIRFDLPSLIVLFPLGVIFYSSFDLVKFEGIITAYSCLFQSKAPNQSLMNISILIQVINVDLLPFASHHIVYQGSGEMWFSGCQVQHPLADLSPSIQRFPCRFRFGINRRELWSVAIVSLFSKVINQFS